MSRVDDLLLMSYADGELDDAAARAVEETLRQDAGARARLEAFRASAALVRSAYPCRDGEPLPEGLLDLLRRHDMRHRSGWLARLGVAAAIATGLIVALGLGYWAGHDQAATRNAVLENSRHDALAQVSTLLGQALQRSRNGDTVSFSLGAGTEFSVTPLLTFVNRSGEFCREFREVLHGPHNTFELIGLACREPAGNWRVIHTLLPGLGPESLLYEPL